MQVLLLLPAAPTQWQNGAKLPCMFLDTDLLRCDAGAIKLSNSLKLSTCTNEGNCLSQTHRKPQKDPILLTGQDHGRKHQVPADTSHFKSPPALCQLAWRMRCASMRLRSLSWVKLRGCCRQNRGCKLEIMASTPRKRFFRSILTSAWWWLVDETTSRKDHFQAVFPS